jgi:hypothetical protein
MTATASTQTHRPANQHLERNPNSAGLSSMRSKKNGQSRRALPAFPQEALYFEAKFIDNSQVVRADDPKSLGQCMKTVFAVATVSIVAAGLMLPSAIRIITAQRIIAERARGEELRGEITEYQASIAKRTNPEHLEAYAAEQKMSYPQQANVQTVSAKGTYAKNNSLPSGK